VQRYIVISGGAPHGHETRVVSRYLQDKMKRILWLFGLFVTVCVGGALMANRAWQWSQTEPTQYVPPSPLRLRAARPVYPFSVIPGGIYDSGELSDSVKLDPVIREHYKDVRSEFLWTTRTQKPVLAYVSYRKGDSVGWTRNKLRIPKGELVLTDGKNLIRARCGNRIQELPPPLASAPPTSGDEPPVIIFESPSVGPLAPLPPQLRPVAPGIEPFMPVISGPPIPYGPSGTPPGSPSKPTPTPTPVPSSEPTPPPTSEPTPIPVIPEPGTLVLIVSGLGGLWGLSRRRRG
jgi:hypothetical protein